MEKIVYKKSLQAKLVLERETIPYYQSIKDLCATHKDVTTRLSFNKETISYGKNKVALIKIARKNMYLALNLDPMKYDNSNYNFKDVTDTKLGENYPMVVVIKNEQGLKKALELLEDALANVGATELVEAENVDYAENLYARSFEELLGEGLIKKYVRVLVAGEEVEVEIAMAEELVNVNFTARLVYEAQDMAEDLYIITSYNNWDLKEAVKMERHADNTFTATIPFPKGTLLEFKICRSKNWEDVEKGIWNEEIVNHNYILVGQDLYVEDLIHNFRH